MAAHVEVRLVPNWEDNIDMQRVLTVLGQDIVEDARRFCPVSSVSEPGYIHLRDDIDFEVFNGTGEFPTLRVGNKTKDYSVYVELGTSKAQAQPYLRPAVEKARTIRV